MPSSLTPGSSTSHVSSLRDADTAFAEIRAARHSQHSRNPFHARPVFRGFTGSRLLRPFRLLAPLDGSDQVSPATGDFYIQASGGSVALPAAGYDYNSNWTPLLAGLSPAGMAASLAAPDLTEFPRPPGAFTSRLPAGRSPFPPLDMTTTATGLLCWRDFHPQEWQLASLHQIRAGPIRVGSHLGCLTAKRSLGQG